MRGQVAVPCNVCMYCAYMHGRGRDRMVECDHVQGGGYFPVSEILEEGCRYFVEDKDYIGAHVRPAL